MFLPSNSLKIWMFYGIVFLLLCIPVATRAVDVSEDFSSGMGGFSDAGSQYSLKDGRLIFTGDNSSSGSLLAWSSPSNSGGLNPKPTNDNYFTNFNVSIGTEWLNGDKSNASGILVCTQINELGMPDSVRFAVNDLGMYYVSVDFNGNRNLAVDWTRSSDINMDKPNQLSIIKRNSEFRFFINYNEVKRLIIDGCTGGGIGLYASNAANFAFDNFKITKLTVPPDFVPTPIVPPPVTENFNSGLGGFSNQSDQFSIKDGRLVFAGDNTNTSYSLAWSSPYNSGSWNPIPTNDNYFTNFNVTTSVEWLNGDSESGGGISVCSHKNNLGTRDSLRFYIDNQGFYAIDTIQNGEYSTLVDWKKSSQLIIGKPNQLAVVKRNSEFRFFINYREVEKLFLDDCAGGAVGIAASNNINMAFDNFTITPLDVTVAETFDLPARCQSTCLPNKPCVCFEVAKNKVVTTNSFFKVDDRLLVNLLMDVKQANRFDRVDLYVAFEFPNGGWQFINELGSRSTYKVPYQRSLETAQGQNYILLDIKVPPSCLGSNVGGKYKLYAVFVMAGADIEAAIKNQNFASNVAMYEVELESFCPTK